MAKTTLIIPNEEQSRFYKLIFDGSSFSWAINTIESLIKDEKSYFPLMKSLREKFGYDNVEDIDHYHNNRKGLMRLSYDRSFIEKLSDIAFLTFAGFSVVTVLIITLKCLSLYRTMLDRCRTSVGLSGF